MRGGQLRVAAHLGIKDEAGLVEPCIAHLRAIGVDEFIVHDIGSRDGSRELLRREQSEGFRVIEIEDEASEADLNASVHDAVASCRADWVLMLDADEFPLPRRGDLRAALAARAEHVLELPRYNVVLGPNGPHLPLPPRAGLYDTIDLYAKADLDLRSKLEAGEALAWIRMVPHPKVAVRPGHLDRLTPGAHAAKPKLGSAASRAVADDIVVAHLAVSDFPRFAGKVSNMRATIRHVEAEVAPNYGWHWRRWVALDEAGALRDEWDRSVVGPAEREALRRAGVVRSASDLLGQSGGVGEAL